MALATRMAAAAVGALVALAAPAAWAARTPVEAAEPSFAFRPGVIVDPARSAIYGMAPERGIDAVDLVSGALRWHSDRATRPLLPFGDLLVAQAETPPGAAPRLRLVLLDVDDPAAPAREIDVPLPAGVEPRIDEGLESSFELDAHVHGSDLVVSWSSTHRRATGTPSSGEAAVARGSVRIDPATGEFEAGDESAAPPAPEPPVALRQLQASGALPGPLRRAGNTWIALERTTSGARQRVALRRWDAGTGQALPDVPLFDGGLTFRSVSADGRHLLASRRDPADPGLWEWAIFSLETGRRVGAVRIDTPGARFFVHGGRLVYETSAILEPAGGAMRVEPPRLRAIDLESGSEAWSRPFRDTRYRGSAPPQDTP